MTTEHDTHHDENGASVMALPLSNGKLAMWLFLVTEIMFFTALIGTYLILRNAVPTHPVVRWPTPEDVHLVEWIGAFNTFVLILSSLTVVLAHYAAGKGQFRNATLYVAATAALGILFLAVKAYEYNSKFKHDILPGHIGELVSLDGAMELTEERLKHAEEHKETHHAKQLQRRLDEMREYEEKQSTAEFRREQQFHTVGMQYVVRVSEQLKKIVEGETGKEWDKVTDADVKGKEIVRACYELRQKIERAPDPKTGIYISPPTPAQVGAEVNKILHLAHEKHEDVHLSPAIPYGNMWASCYFAMTGFHALHVLGGIVIFIIYLIVGARGKLGPQHVAGLEYTGLYWHFVDIVWIFLFPLLYLV